MVRARYLFAAAWATATCATAFACGDPQAPVGATAEAGIADVTLADGAWGTTACAACTFDACREERAACRAEPGCARNLDCIEACPSTSDGDPEPTCESECQTASASAAEGSRLAFDRCRSAGRATACESCVAAHRRRYTSPLLNQTCPSPVWDAGPDATPVREACTRCGAMHCCDQRVACRADPACSDLWDCEGECKTQACIDACSLAHESVVGGYWGMLSCTLVFCTAECEAPADRCARCLFDDCADTTVTCEADHDCYFLAKCSGSCDSEACRAACGEKYPGAAALYSAQLLCVQKKCPGCF